MIVYTADNLIDLITCQPRSQPEF